MAAVEKSLLDGFFKTKYGELSNSFEPWAILGQRLKLTKRNRVGDEYHYPVLVRRPQGDTWVGGANVGKATTLNAPVPMETQRAEISSTEWFLQEDIAYGVLTRAQEQGEEAFGDAMALVVMAMRETAQFKKELALLYGNSSGGIGVVENPVADNGTVQEFQITKGTWSDAIWDNLEGGYVDVYDNNTYPPDTKRNAAGTLKVSAVDYARHVVELTGTEAEMDAIAAGDIIVPRDAIAGGGWFDGLDSIIGTSSGTFQQIDADTYSQWRPNTYSAGTKLTMQKVQAAVTLAGARGLKGNTLVQTDLYSWQDLNNDTAALRRFAQSTKASLDIGTENITFYGATGKLEIEAHPLIKAGDAFVYQPEDLVLLGSTDITHRINNAKGQQDNFYQDLEQQTAIRLRCMFDLALTHKRRKRCTKITNISPASLAHTSEAAV